MQYIDCSLHSARHCYFILHAVFYLLITYYLTKVYIQMKHITLPTVLIKNSFFFFFFFNCRYKPRLILACFTISFHNLLSLHFSLQFLTFSFFKSSSTCSNNLSLGLPTGLDEYGYHSVSFLTVLIVSILITCAAQRNFCDCINLTIVFS